MSMPVLMLALVGPLQSWGASSRFTVRDTEREPTKSGVIGLIASALGRSREDRLDDLCGLEMGVRIDQPGEIMRDFQTEHQMGSGKSMPLSNRYYLADAKFLVALSGDRALLESIERALMRPARPLYLGRRSCPADMPIVHRQSFGPYEDVRVALRSEPWIASEWYRKRLERGEREKAFPELEVVSDARPGESGESHADLPLSFGAVRRYGQRSIVRQWVANPSAPDDGDTDVDKEGLAEILSSHDPMKF